MAGSRVELVRPMAASLLEFRPPTPDVHRSFGEFRIHSAIPATYNILGLVKGSLAGGAPSKCIVNGIHTLMDVSLKCVSEQFRYQCMAWSIAYSITHEGQSLRSNEDTKS